jgi:thioredoxin 1
LIKVELIAAAGCSKCAGAKSELKSAAESVAKHRMVWREINVLDEIDYVVSLGVLTLPAIAIDGVLVFKSLPSAAQMHREIEKRLEAGA